MKASCMHSAMRAIGKNAFPQKQLPAGQYAHLHASKKTLNRYLTDTQILKRRQLMAIIAIVGRPNVGKSTLFNRISKSSRALVDDLPGVTRDRNYAGGEWDEKSFTLVDTGGFIIKDDCLFDQSTREQIFHALQEADMLLFVADGKTGLHPEDSALLNILRRTSKPIFFAVNKIDGAEL